jgi:hypothetical protein
LTKAVVELTGLEISRPSLATRLPSPRPAWQRQANIEPAGLAQVNCTGNYRVVKAEVFGAPHAVQTIFFRRHHDRNGFPQTAKSTEPYTQAHIKLSLP